ncbi:MAG TPA: hypothetical protein VGN97_15295 [Mesorhizobium sp.]|jgi:hypothetical protein|nr:hypothetical protein [Mesorhizobium sp.]
MTDADVQYLIVTSMFPVGALILAAVVVFLTSGKPRDHVKPGE